MGASSACLLLSASLCGPGALGLFANQRYDSSPPENRAVTPPAVAALTTSSAPEPAKGRFLVASQKLVDPNFAETVVLLLAYAPSGALGVVVNRPTDVRLGSVLRDVEELRSRSDPLFLGGPIAGSVLLVLIRASQRPESSEPIFEGVYLGGSRGALREALRKSRGTNRVRGYAGHAGWGPRQLDHEIARGAWHVTTADATTVFDMEASAIWPKLIQRFSDEWTRPDVPARRAAAACLSATRTSSRSRSHRLTSVSCAP
jgi:putative transcriptional regulator